MAGADNTEIDDEGKERKARRFDARDWGYISEYVIDEYNRRKNERDDLEKCWKDIDRQIAMEPELAFKKLPNGEVDRKKSWMAEVELPLQAQALEVLTADARRMLFPDSGAWFRAHAEMTDEYLSKIDYQSILSGDEAEVPTKINQDNADKLVEGFLLHLFNQSVGDNTEDFYTRYDKINAESFKYGVGVGRARMWTRNLYVKARNGVRREVRKVPVLMPCSVKNLYLDDRQASTHSTQLLEPAHIAVDHIKLENLQIAANRGSDDPDDDDGGWMPKNLKGLIGDKQGYVTLLEMEGDLIVPRKTTRSVVIPGAIVTVVLGANDSGGNSTQSVVRFRYRKSPFSTYLLHPYHYEGADDVYPTSPLMKGRPVQMMCTDALNRLLDSSMLKNAPPISYDRTDQFFAQKGGPEIYPYAVWGSSDPASIKAHTEIGGDPSALAAVMRQGLSFYAELTGVLPARLGAQTTSHTTAFAKDAELQRGAVRTVDYVRQIGHGPMTKWLDMAYRMARDAISDRSGVSFFIDAYGGYVEVRKDQLPERATFEWFGSGGPADEQQKAQRKLQALGLAVQMDQMGIQAGRPAKVDLTKAISEVLRQGGWTDIDAIITPDAPLQPQQPPPQPMLEGPQAPPALPDLTGGGGMMQ